MVDRTFHEPNLIRIKTDSNYLDPLNCSDADLNSSQTKFKRRKMLISVKLLTEYIIIIYALGYVHKKVQCLNQSCPKVLPVQLGMKNGTELFQIQTGVPN